MMGYSHTTLHQTPLAFFDVLLAPQIIKTLIFIRKFFPDNSMSKVFDPFDFSAKEVKAGEHNNEI